MNNTVHFTLQGKGGVGKSFVTSMLAQYIRDHKKIEALSIADTDPVNATLAQFKDLGAVVINITENNTIIQSKFDSLFSAILTNDGTFVIDNGSSTFLPLLKYFNDNEVVQMIADSGKEVFIHTVLVGGQSASHALNGYKTLRDMLKGTNAKIVVWLNEAWGPVVDDEGKPLAESGLFKKSDNLLAGVVTIVNRNSEAFSTDLTNMTSNSLTLKEVEKDASFNIMSRSRLFRVFNDVYKQLDVIFE